MKALELLEKLADERSRLIEDKLTSDKLVESLRSRVTNDKRDETANDNDQGQLQSYFEEKLRTKAGENLKLQKIIAESKIQDANQQTGTGSRNDLKCFV